MDTNSRTALPLHKNPVRKARERLKLSLTAVSKKAGVNYQTWYNTECGCYSKVPLKIEDFLANEGFSLSWLEKEYTDYVWTCREEFSINYSSLLACENLNTEVKTFKDLREHLGLSRQAVAKELCVQPAVLYKLESGRSKKLPAQLKEALLEVGLSTDLLRKLEKNVGK